ncbi:MAG: hypothetical protein OES09_16195, partial [Gammaproteobacteria bacterium]|nr:hypothetical protein [Gammaproteobacteria bacterium]
SMDVSLIRLIANPDNYQGRKVRVIGVAILEFEDNNLWVSKEALKYRVLKNAIWIEPNFEKLGASSEALSKYNGKYVLIEGTFNKNNSGHMGLSVSAIENVTRYQLWEK